MKYIYVDAPEDFIEKISLENNMNDMIAAKLRKGHIQFIYNAGCGLVQGFLYRIAIKDEREELLFHLTCGFRKIPKEAIVRFTKDFYSYWAGEYDKMIARIL